MRNKAAAFKIYALISVVFLFTASFDGIKAQCNANFSNITICCDTVEFTDLSSVGTGDTITFFSWDWGDGGTSFGYGPSPSVISHVYQPGTYTVTLIIETQQGCSDTAYGTAIAYESPNADFASDTACVGSPTQFTDLSTSPTSPVTSWHWDFGTGATSNLQNPVYMFPGTGIYNVCLTVTSANYCSDMTCKEVVVFNTSCLLANFTYASCNCINDSICFVDQSISGGNTIISWLWDFGDGQTSTESNPCHLYSSAGTYSVSLTITDNLGGSDDTTVALEVNPKPVADFADSACCSFDVYFTDLSIANADSLNSWHWSFGDGGTSNLQNPVHTYPSIGNYNVCLTVTNSNCCIDSSCRTISVTYPPGSSGLTANFSAPDSSCVNVPVEFTDLSIAMGASIISWDWDFGDGNTATVQNVTHSYLFPGLYDVMLTVTADSMGTILTDQVTHPILIFENPQADFTHDNGVCHGDPVQFTSSTSTAVESYFWEFGDGDTSSLQHPQHIYQAGGDYTVTLTVSNIVGCSDIVQKIVNINEPDANFSFIPASPNPGDTVFFTDLSTSSSSFIIQWIWYFGDGDSTIIDYPDNPNVWHVYSDSGNYNVSLHVIDSDSCLGIVTDNVLVFSSNPVYPIADFVYTNTCLNYATEFTDMSSANSGSNLASWFWDFGDGYTSNLQNPSHLYMTAGTYAVSLVVTNEDNLSDTALYNIVIYPPPDVSATTDPSSALVGDPIQFYGLSNDSTIISWYWSFGDGTTSILQNPIHSYQSFGYYNAGLTVTDAYGCINSASIQIYIYSSPAFPEDSTIWNTVGDNSITNQTWRFRYGLIGDTTISVTDADSAYTYSKVYSLYDSTFTNPNSTYFAALRKTEDKKVYVLLPGFEEALLYDFTLDVGDTIWYVIGGSLCYNGISFIAEDHYKVVTAIDSVQIETGEIRKRWHLEDYPNTIMTDIWIEGIGSVVWYGLFNPLINDVTLCGDNYDFACMKEGDVVIYLSNPHCEECFCQLMTTVVENGTSSDNKLNIYPNPATSNLIIEMDRSYDKAEIYIYYSTGQCIYHKINDPLNNAEVDVSAWKAGIYFVKVIYDTDHMAGQRFVVK